MSDLMIMYNFYVSELESMGWFTFDDSMEDYHYAKQCKLLAKKYLREIEKMLDN